MKRPSQIYLAYNKYKYHHYYIIFKMDKLNTKFNAFENYGEFF